MTGFGGGIAEEEDVCGAVVSSVIIFGALYGRKDVSEDQSTCWKLCAEFRRRFQETFSSTNCHRVKAFQSQHWHHESCLKTVEGAIRLLLKLLAEQNQGGRESTQED